MNELEQLLDELSKLESKPVILDESSETEMMFNLGLNSEQLPSEYMTGRQDEFFPNNF